MTWGQIELREQTPVHLDISNTTTAIPRLCSRFGILVSGTSGLHDQLIAHAPALRRSRNTSINTTTMRLGVYAGVLELPRLID